MALREGEKQIRKHVWLFESDVEEVKVLFGATIGESKAIRLMLRKCLQQIKAKAQARTGAQAPTRVPDLSDEMDKMMEESQS